MTLMNNLYANIVTAIPIACAGALGVLALVATLFHITQAWIEANEKPRSSEPWNL